MKTTHIKGIPATYVLLRDDTSYIELIGYANKSDMLRNPEYSIQSYQITFSLDSSVRKLLRLRVRQDPTYNLPSELHQMLEANGFSYNAEDYPITDSKGLTELLQAIFIAYFGGHPYVNETRLGL
jgi:hypothetical protein